MDDPVDPGELHVTPTEIVWAPVHRIGGVVLASRSGGEPSVVAVIFRCQGVNAVGMLLYSSDRGWRGLRTWGVLLFGLGLFLFWLGGEWTQTGQPSLATLCVVGGAGLWCFSWMGVR